jgi:uncharacterized protein YprB with RNaseH-like and TPR domain
VRSPHFRRPAIVLYDRVQGGVGLSERAVREPPRGVAGGARRRAALRVRARLPGVRRRRAANAAARESQAPGVPGAAGAAGEGRGRHPLPTALPARQAGLARTRGAPLGLGEGHSARGSFGERITRYGPRHLHGHQALERVLAARGPDLATLTGDLGLAAFDPRGATFLDIETTGLSGGAGTQVFLVGLLTHRDGGFELWQGFLRSPAEAPALLQACAERVSSRGPLVSFFGKSFDRHRLEDQMRLHGVTPPFAGRPHLDLYHPCRRLYGECFGDGRLSTMERELCGVHREHDLPGAFAPAAWFDFLADREHDLEAVFRHNELDVLSLATLCSHVAAVLDPGPPGPAVDPALADPALADPALSRARARALARAFLQRRDWPRTLEWSERSLLHDGLDRECLALRGRALQRLGRLDEALADFEALARAAEDGLAAEAWAEAAWIAQRLGQHGRAREAHGRARPLALTHLTGLRAARVGTKLARIRPQGAVESL